MNDLSEKLKESGGDPGSIIEDVAGTRLVSEKWSDEVKAEIVDKLSFAYEEVPPQGELEV